MASVFTKIIHGELPCYKIAEDEHTFSFLALDQIQLGHTLVVSKSETDHLMDVQEPEYSAIFQQVQKVSKAISESTNCKRVGLIVAGFEVSHCHVHLVPLWTQEQLSFEHAKQLPAEEMKKIQEQIQGKLK